MSVKIIAITPDAETLMGYCARVSNPANQDNPDVEKLLGYCARNGHWSVFEMANMILEFTTSRAISPQILRHRSFSFQEFSQRYSSPTDGGFIRYRARRQDTKNRQNSIDDLSQETKDWFNKEQELNWDYCKNAYDIALQHGIAKECARFLLPGSTLTRLYMNGTVRSWVHYLSLRTKPGTQLEHLELALEAKKIFIENLPKTARGLEWA